MTEGEDDGLPDGCAGSRLEARAAAEATRFGSAELDDQRKSPPALDSLALSRESRSNHVEALWKHRPQQSAADTCGPWLAERIGQQAAVDLKHLLAPYTQEVARSSRAPPIVTSPRRSGTSRHPSADGQVLDSHARRSGSALAERTHRLLSS